MLGGMLMKLIHNFFTIFILCLFFIFPTNSLADDVYFDEIVPSNITEATSSSIDSAVPIINARHAVIYDRASKTILYGKNENEQCKMASTTKILTAIVVLENTSDLSSIVSVSSKAAHTGRFKIGAIYR